MRLLLFLAFLVVPVLEIWLLIQVGEVIGGWPTVGHADRRQPAGRLARAP